MRGLYSEGNLRLQIDWARLIVRSKLPFLCCFTLYLRAFFQVQAPGGLIFGGPIYRRVFCVTGFKGLYLEGLIHGGAYFRNITVCSFTLYRLALRRRKNLTR